MKRNPVIDATSETWQAVEAYALAKREDLRTKLESTGMPEIETAVARGRIAALKDLLALGKAPAEAADEGVERF